MLMCGRLEALQGQRGSASSGCLSVAQRRALLAHTEEDGQCVASNVEDKGSNGGEFQSGGDKCCKSGVAAGTLLPKAPGHQRQQGHHPVRQERQ